MLRSLPSIERMLARPDVERLSEVLSRDRVRDLLREILEEMREHILSGRWPVVGRPSQAGQPAADLLIEEIRRRLEDRANAAAQPSLRRVINATGVIVHTNLGRAPLAAQALESLSEVASHYSNLEYDLIEGRRGARESHCQQLLARLAGSESAIVANNNAAAVMLVLNTLAEGGEVIVSRGELIEIGGSFRIPDVMTKSGARLREVGTTNRTRIQDYAQAINENTRLIFRVHPSNYRIIGFTERPTVKEIADLAGRAGIPSFEDLGSGCLIDLAPYGVKDEPVVACSLRAGISVVSFSGDKMLGGPQAGVIAGSRVIVDRVRKNPLMRALRAGKLTYAALESTLRLYERGVAESEIPVIRAMARTQDDLSERARRFGESIERMTERRIKVTIEDGESVIGGGSAPEVKLPTVLIAIEGGGLSASQIEQRLRDHRVPVITRTEHSRVLIDLRTVEPDEETVMLEAIAALAQPVPETAASVEV